ncbi:MAG: hypothetical protein GTO17_05155 [Candidatus Aminicenantes bacterium]|nr:hypothetical protein [Candidatus Aminicenantes bacterium]
MTSKERVKRAMDLGEPDRVPLMCQLSIGHMLQQTGFSPAEFWFSADLFAEGLLQLRETYGFDGILISLHGHSPSWKEETEKIQTEEKAEVVYWKNGERTDCLYDGLPRHHPHDPPSPPGIQEFDPVALPEEIGFIPVSQGLEFRIHPEHKYDVFDIINQRAGEEYSIHGEVTSPFDYFLNLFGLQRGMVYLIQEPSKAKEILQRYADGVKRMALEQIEHGIDALKISSPYAGAGFISPGFYREFVLPYEGQIARAVRSCGVHAYTHTCGAISDRLEMMIETGISGIECLDPPPLGNVRLAEAKKRLEGKVFIKGNIDPVNVLLFGSREVVEKDAEYRIKVAKPGGGFILSTACSVAPHTKRENIQVLARVIEEEGYY